MASLFVPALEASFGWTRGQIAAAAGWALAGAVAAPLLGRLTDRLGVRPVLLTSILAFGAVYVGFAFQTGDIGLYYALFAAFAVAGMGTTGITYTRVLTNWFSAARGFALAAALSVISLVAIVVPPALNAVLETWGLRGGYLFMAALALGIGLPIALLLIREAPPGGTAAPVAAAEPTPERRSAWADFLALARRGDFWVLSAACVLINLPGVAIMGQFVPLLRDKGLSGADAAAMLSVYAASVFVGRLAGGYLIDRVWPPAVAFVLMAAPGLACLLLLPAELSMAVAIGAAVLLGLQHGAELDVIPFFVARQFEAATYASTYGLMVAAIVGSGAVGAIIVGAAYDRFGDYQLALGAMAGCFFLGAASFLALRAPRRTT